MVATPADFQEVRELVQQIDQGGKTTEETVSTYTISGNVNPDVMKAALESILGQSSDSEEATKSPSAKSSKAKASKKASPRSGAEIQRRRDFYRMLRGAGRSQGGGGGKGGAGKNKVK